MVQVRLRSCTNTTLYTSKQYLQIAHVLKGCMDALNSSKTSLKLEIAHSLKITVELLLELTDLNNGDSDQIEHVYDLIDMSTHCLIVGSVTWHVRQSKAVFRFCFF